MGWGEIEYHPMGRAHWHEGRKGVTYLDEWSPSTDWSAAGEVLEKLKQRGIYLGVWSGPDGYDIENYENGQNWVAGVSTGPLAICLAALEAAGSPGA